MVHTISMDGLLVAAAHFGSIQGLGANRLGPGEQPNDNRQSHIGAGLQQLMLLAIEIERELA